MKNKKPTSRNPWSWVPTLYYAEGIPYIIVMTVSVIMYKRMGISNTDIALYTSWLYLPYVIKPLWGPLVDILRTKRFWIVTMQLVVGAGLAGVALTIPLPSFFQYTMAFFWLLAFSSATHDISADGFYMLGLTKHEQAFFVGVRSTFYRFAMITGQGLLIILAGYFESATGLPTYEMEIAASPDTENVRMVHPDSLDIQPLEGELRIMSVPENMEIHTGTVEASVVDSVVNFAKTWNLTHNFYEEEVKAPQPERGEEDVDDESGPSWWDSYVVTPVEDFIRSTFGPDEKLAIAANKTGNVDILYFHLSGKPEEGEEVVVNFGREGGDKSIEVVEGTRFVFTADNWNVPAAAVIQLDPKLDEYSTASFEARAGNIPLAWIITFAILSGMFILFFVYHKFILPYPKSDKPAVTSSDSSLYKEFFRTFILFFKKKQIGVAILFLLTYRLAESQIVKLASPFLLDPREVGGLGLTTGEVGIIYGTIGLLALTLGGILGGYVASRQGLKFWLWPMVFAMNIPNLVYVYFSYLLPDSFVTISAGIALEQFGYGFGFTAYMLYMIYISEGDHKTSHFAITTAFMALGMMIPGMISGWLQELIGYQHFFIWVIIATIPAFLATKLIRVDSEFGKKTAEEETEEA